MRVKLKRYTISETCNIKGKVVECRYGYVIAVKRHWWNKTRYVNLLQDWYHDLNDEEKTCKIELHDSIRDATRFEDQRMTIYSKAAAEAVVALIKEQPDKFILT